MLDIDNHKTTFEQLTGKRIKGYDYNVNSVGLLPSMCTYSKDSPALIPGMLSSTTHSMHIIMGTVGILIALVVVFIYTRKAWLAYGRRVLYALLAVIVLLGLTYMVYTYGIETCCGYFRICVGNLLT